VRCSRRDLQTMSGRSGDAGEVTEYIISGRSYNVLGVWPITQGLITMAIVKEVEIMPLESMHLRLESRNGSPAKECRIEGGNVEVRTFDCEPSHARVWTRLTPEQLSTHVRRHTVVSRWLESRLGWRPLLRACVGLEPRIPSASSAEGSDVVKQEQAWVCY